MPLVAELDGVRIESWRLGPETWSELKQSYRSSTLTMLCGMPAVPKISSLGMQFFAHASGAACELHVGADESPEHLAAKELVAAAARTDGWEATVEYAGPDRAWIADVLVERDDHRIAIEIQLSAQDEHEFKRRTRRYWQAGLGVVWLLGPKNRERLHQLQRNGIEAYMLGPELGAQTIRLPALLEEWNFERELGAGVSMMLGGAVAKRMEVIVSDARVFTEMKKCWTDGCRRWFTSWHVYSLVIETRCGSKARLASSAPYRDHAKSRFEQHDVVQEKIRSQIGASDLPSPCYYGFRTSRRVPGGYIAQACPHCGALQGDGMDNEGGRAQVYKVPVRSYLPVPTDLLDHPHVCVDNGRGRCFQTQQFDGPTFGGGGLLSLSDEGDWAVALPPKGARRRR